MSGRRSTWLVICVSVVVALLAGTALVVARGRDAGTSLTLVDHEGKPFSIERTRGNTTVLSFMFSHCPAICPTQTRALKEVQAMLPDAVRSRVAFVSVSVDPERDTPLALKDFATRLGIELGTWTFVTGSGTLRLAEHYKAEVTRDEEGQLDHRAAVYLLDAQGRLAQTYTGAPIDRRRLAREIEVLDRSPAARTSSDGRLSQRTP